MRLATCSNPASDLSFAEEGRIGQLIRRAMDAEGSADGFDGLSRSFVELGHAHRGKREALPNAAIRFGYETMIDKIEAQVDVAATSCTSPAARPPGRI